MKKIILLAAAGSLALLPSCGKKSAHTVTTPDGSLDPCELRFSWWGGDDRHEATLNAIKFWNSLYPDIKITPEYGGWDGWTEKAITQISGGTAPDVMQINYDWLITLSPEGDGFYDLYQLTNNLDISPFSKETLSFGEVNGKLNAITVSVSGRGLFYNSQVYRELNAEYPETWNELIDLGKIFGEHDLYPLDLDIQSGGTAWYLAVVYTQQSTGREFISMDGDLGFTKDDIAMALNFYKSLEDNHVIRTVKSRTDDDGNAALYQSAEFIGGKVAGVLEWGSAIGKYESVLGDGVLETGEFLTDDNGNSGGWMAKPSLLYAISPYTKHPDESAAFMNFLLNNKDCAEILGTSRGIPASKYALEQLRDSGMLSGLSMENSTMLDKLDIITVSPYMELTQVKDMCNSAIEKISYGSWDTIQAAEELYQSLSDYLGSIKK